MLVFDTETVGLTGPLITIQWYSGDTPTQENVHIHYVWEDTVQHTSTLIESFCNAVCVMGFNLVFDWFQLTKWYNVLRRVKNKNEPPNQEEVAKLEAQGPQFGDYCLKPTRSCDVMLHARAGEFQYLAKHKPITIRKVPVQILQLLIDKLTCLTTSILPGVSFRWRISEKRNYQRTDVKDIIGESTSIRPRLKSIASIIYDDPSIVQKGYEEEVGLPPYKDMPDYHPWGGNWQYGLSILRNQLLHDSRAITYAKNDVIYTHALWKFLDCPSGGDVDSELACLIGASHWKGFALTNKEKLCAKLKYYQEEKEKAPTAPGAVLEYLYQFLSNNEKIIVRDTEKTTLEELIRWKDHPVSRAAYAVKQARRAERRINLLRKLISAGSFNFSMKVSGAASLRMSGGESEAKKGNMNAQGIPREKDFRSLFPLAYPPICSGCDVAKSNCKCIGDKKAYEAWKGEHLEGGDFAAFEPTIIDAIVHDSQFKKDLESKLKIHLFAGSEFYKLPPEEIAHTKGTDNDKYIRSKNAFLGWIYGAHQSKIAQVLDLSENEVEQGYQRIRNRYPQLEQYRKKLYEQFTPLRQERGIGTEITWTVPQKEIKGLLGATRNFTLDWKITLILYSLATTPPLQWTNIPGDIRRTNRVQTVVGATASALYSAIFALQSHVYRAAVNHEIQSTGAQITKALQERIWKLQPSGIHSWLVRPLNIHDEIMCPTTLPQGKIKQVVDGFITDYSKIIPLLRMEWKNNLTDWGEKE